MAGETRSALVSEDTSATDALAAGAVGLSAVLFALALAALFGAIAIDGTVAGVPVVAALGGLLLLLGGAVVAFGVGSRLGYVTTTPRESAGLVAGVAFALLWGAAGGLVASAVLGFGTGVMLVVVCALAGAAFVATTVPREDVGSTVPSGAMTAIVGLVFLSGLVGPSWVWDLGWAQTASFTAGFAVPVVTQCCALLSGWSAAKAYGGFGATGRHLGAYLLIYLNAVSIVGVLFLLVAFTAVQGVPGVLNGVEVGPGVGPESTVGLFGVGVTFAWPIAVPFVTNGVGLMNDVQGILPAIVGTFWLVVGALLFAVPLGLGAATFLTEYAERGRFTQVVEVATNGLWSTPSIVFGLFGFAFLVPRFGHQKSLLSGMLTLGFMLLPLVVITSREAMLSVPDEYRDASAALGVTRWQTIRSVVVPAAMPGVVTGVILGVGRVAGETAPILLTMAGGVFVPGGQTVDVLGGFHFTGSPPFVANPELLRATSALPYQLYALITAGVGLGANVNDPDQFRWATALVLLCVVLSFYAVGIATRYYFRKRLRQ